MEAYFKKTEADIEFYDKYLRGCLPSKIADVHLHISRPEYTANAEEDPYSWAAQCAGTMTAEDYAIYSKTFYPDSEVFVNALPQVTRGADVDGGNGYISRLKRENALVRWAHMLVDPRWNAEETELKLINGGFDGYKPYPDFVSGARGSEIGIFEFVTREQLAVLDKHKKSMVLHLPRAGRYPDPHNIGELLAILEKYPGIKLILAHCGRCYAIDHIRRAKELMGEAFGYIHYDLAAVLNPEVIRFMLENVPHTNIMYATDLPVFLWHGKRRWTNTEYFNLAREDFPWNRHEEGTEAENNYVFFIYEQLKNILDAAEQFGGGELTERLFWKNAAEYLG